MRNVSVVIPYFQRAPGILRRAISSVIQQRLPQDVEVHIIVVDDGSPIPAKSEVEGLDISFPLSLTVKLQQNAGVAAARNRGLDEVSSSATLIAFLDSDDIWPSNHLASVIDAFKAGFDVSFTDNRRSEHHGSYIAECAPETGRIIASARQKTGVVEIPADQMVGLILKEFPAQASTVAYRRNVAPLLRFDTNLKSAGEDLVFLSRLAASANRIGFCLDSCVECGSGVNMYFGNFGWDSPKCMAIRVDQVLAHRLISKMVTLSSSSKRLNDAEVLYYRRELAFHALRNLVKHPSRVLKEITRLVRLDPIAAIMLPGDMICVATAQVFTQHKGKHQEGQL